MRCERILSKGMKKGQTCGVYTNFKMDDGKYMCCTHRKNLKKYATVHEDNTVNRVIEPDVKPDVKSDVKSDAKPVVQPDDVVVKEEPSEMTIETHRLVSLQPEEDTTESGSSEYYDRIRQSMLKIAPVEQVDKYIAQKMSENVQEHKAEKLPQVKNRGVLSDNFDDFRIQVEDCIAQLYDEIIALKEERTERDDEEYYSDFNSDSDSEDDEIDIPLYDLTSLGDLIPNM